MSGKLIKMQVSLGFEPFLLSKSEAERRVVVPTPRVYVQMAGTYLCGRQNLSLLSVSEKFERKTIKKHVFLGFEPFLLSNSEALFPFFCSTTVFY